MNNYERITAAILTALSSELPPWRKPWRALRSAGASGIPQNALTGHAYRGVNALLLLTRFDADARYVTFKQAKAAGGHVKRGEHGTTVIYWEKRRYTARDETGAEELRSSLLMKSYTVFALSQTEGVTLPKSRNAPEPLPPPPTITQVYSTLGTSVQHGGDFACYSPGADVITMPSPEAFSSADSYAATALHEASHATGHTSRLARDLTGRFGSQAYAAEELVAEISAAYLCTSLGVDSSLECHASYVHHWRQLLASDSRAVITASSKAQAAADFILAKLNPAAVSAEASDNSETEAG